jgi:cytoskeleton protein RodZ
MDEAETLGRYLRRERELRKISLRELSKNTRVREHLLKAIEEDRQDLLPSPTFVKGFLNAYAKYVGLNANEIILRYQRGLTRTPENVPDATPERDPRQNGKPRRAFGAWVTGGVIVAGLIVYYFLFLQPAGPRVEPLPPASREKPVEQEAKAPPPVPPQVAEPSPSQNVVPPAPPQIAGTAPSKPEPPVTPAIPAIPATPATQAPAPAAPQIAATLLPQKGKPFSLLIKAVELTWVSVKADNQAEREMLLRPGETIPLEAVSQMYVLVGNAGGLDLIYNGKPLQRFGNSGDVVGLAFTPESFEVKRIEKSKPQ